MSTIQTKKENKKISNKQFKVISEFFAAFLLIFSINIGITLGEAGIPFFDVIYNMNFVDAIWISSWTFAAFLLFEKTGIAANFISLTIAKRNKVITNEEYVLGGLAQLLGGLIAAFLVWIIVEQGVKIDVYTMGGTTPRIKGLFFNEAGQFGWMNGSVVWEPYPFKNDNQYWFAAIQGLICALFIAIAFVGNLLVDAKFKRGIKAKIGRYIILIVCISISTIFTANTTNWVRLMAPAIINQVDSWFNHGDSSMLYTTIIFIAFQTIGILFILFVNNEFTKEREI